ncbi:hypothetical protein AWM75_07640 [Aerococcus urinaehominis]|uniref:CAAX prenyl protease 2/Lysostaphin resistance protein A-like domain-containing protein n=1 Tax=Aerococcus urinaehominis TaxID=128944 RepID=A0A0X8FMK8_9LACT|nr:CPBP family intramembrane glutamic endopeptidase [Aerococcus urinaehominis]AMB99844.1 hypothetical protein AWM75_07640 [Aerococcus urinaehominis]SDM62605.1 Membrane protease YdiL, CAAX protease family [Aerococcus urinaehominis]
MSEKNYPNLFIRCLVMVGYILLINITNGLPMMTLALPNGWGLVVGLVSLVVSFAMIYWLFCQYRKWVVGQPGSDQLAPDQPLGDRQDLAAQPAGSAADKNQGRLAAIKGLGQPNGKLVVIYFLIMRVVVAVLSWLILYLNGDQTTANDQAIIDAFSQGSTVGILVALVVMCLVAPLAEELIFRGLMTHYLFKGKQTHLTAIVASLLFSSVHLSTNFLSFFLYFAMGYIMHRAYFQRMKLVDAMAVHALNNFFATLGVFYLIYFG